MLSLPTIDPSTSHRRLPAWLKRKLPRGNGNFFTQELLRELRLETVCENARCPNRPECYARRTATFMILGNVCTRPCGFCSVPKGRPDDLEDDEPARVAEAAASAGTAARRHHLGDARRPARRRRRPLPPLHPGRARTNRGRRRSADAGLPRRSVGRRSCAGGGAGSLQPQHGDGAAAVQEGARPGLVSAQPRSARPRQAAFAEPRSPRAA